MKVKIAVISGLILACTAVPRAQGDPETGPYLDDAMLPAAPVMYEDAESTNSVIFLMPKNQSFSAWTEGSFKADGIEQFAISNDDRIFLLSQEDAMFLTDAQWEEPGVIQTTEGETTPFGNGAGSEFDYWLWEAASTTNETAGGVGNSNFVQVIFIEPPDVPGIDISYEMIIPEEYEYQIIHAPPEWYEWLNPRVFLPQWADFWMSETNATPVVLVLIKF